MFASGQTLGRYRLEATLGRGGMAEVWRAVDERLGRTVAVKVIQPAHAAQPQFVERFLREARLVAGLEHPNILPVYDFGEADGVPFLVMPHLDGGTLAQRMDGTPIPLAQVAPWIRQLAEALDFAHQAGVLHRDVKPANILIGKGDRPLLADFGIAKAAESSTRLTATGVVVGTPVYMAPELALGKAASPQSDLYALAVLTFELLTGKPPFAGESALSLMHQHVQTPAPLPSAVLGTPSRELDGVFREALAKEPAERQRSCRAFADALASSLSTSERAQVAEGVPGPWSSLAAQPTLHLAATAPSVTAVPKRPTSPFPEATMDQSPPRRRPWLAVAALALTLGAGGYWALRHREPASQDAAPAAAAMPAEQSRSTAAVAAVAISPPAAVPVAVEPPRAPEPQAAAPSPVAPSAGSAGSAPPAVTGRVADERATFGEVRALKQRLFDPAVGLRRPTRSDFEALLAGARELQAKRPEATQAKWVEIFAAGGIAYLDGRTEPARAALVQILAASGDAAFVEASPLRFARAGASVSTLGDWQLAVGYGDARREAGAPLDRALATQPGDATLRLARAFLDHLDGRHEAARAAADTLYAASPGAAAARLLAEETQHLGRAEEALRWYRIAISAAGRDAGPIALQAAQLAARELKRPDEAREILADACAVGDALACRESERFGTEGGGRSTLRQGPRPFPQRLGLGARRRPPG
jgi:serine/threonine-protein kinase